MVIGKRLAVVLVSVFALLLAVMPTALANPLTSVAIGDASNVAVGGTADVDITITTDDPEGIGSASITLTYDCSVVEVAGIVGGGLPIAYWNTVGCTTTIAAVTGSSPGPTGSVLFATVTLNAVGSAGQSSALDIEVTALYDGTAGYPQPITPSPVTDGTFSIISSTPTPTTTPVTWDFPHGLLTDPPDTLSAVFSRHYDGTTIILADIPNEDFPDELIVLWLYDEEAMEWKWFKPGWPESTLETLEYCHIYDVIVTYACTWEIPQP